mmetsp:Transcript_21929/g.62279  ORF Transcript_21929/g.62279 Transcript_21929/m.62279 type:complete len:225 (-) Transcript_21929:164-838(-)
MCVDPVHLVPLDVHLVNLAMDHVRAERKGERDLILCQVFVRAEDHVADLANNLRERLVQVVPLLPRRRGLPHRGAVHDAVAGWACHRQAALVLDARARLDVELVGHVQLLRVEGLRARYPGQDLSGGVVGIEGATSEETHRTYLALYHCGGGLRDSCGRCGLRDSGSRRGSGGHGSSRRGSGSRGSGRRNGDGSFSGTGIGDGRRATGSASGRHRSIADCGECA